MFAKTTPAVGAHGGISMNRTASRRRFVKGASALVTAFMPLVRTVRETHAYSRPMDYNPSGVPFMEMFWDGAYAIVRDIRDTQIGNIVRAMEAAHESKRKGGTIYSNLYYGHYAQYAGSRNRPGQPWVLPHYAALTKEQFASMKPGDFLLTNYADQARREARDRGVFVAGVTNNYMRFYKTPPDGMNPNRMEVSIEDVSTMVIDSQVPWNNGLVATPKIPHFRLCPSSGISQYAVYWACTASLAALIGSKGGNNGAELAGGYLSMTLDRFERIRTDRPKIDRIARKWADLTLYKNARLYVYGRPLAIDGNHPPLNMFANDAVDTASSAMWPRLYDESKVTSRDIVLIGSEYSDHPGDLETARKAKERGAYTVAFCPYATEGDASGPRLFKAVDDALNTYCDERAGVLAVPGYDEKICPLTGLAGNLLLWMLTAQWAEHMLLRGEIPYFWMNHDERGGREYDNAVEPYFMQRGY